MSMNDEIRSKNIRHQIGLQRYSTSVVKEILKLLKQVDKDLVKRLSENNISEMGKYRLDALLLQVRASIDEAYRKITAKIKERLRDYFQLELDFQVGTLKYYVMPVVFDVITPDATMLFAAIDSRPLEGRFLKDIFEGMPLATVDRVNQSLRLGYVEGKTNQQIVKDLIGSRAAKYSDGIMQTSRRSAEGIVRTALNHVSNAARDEIYSANEQLIKGVQWVSTLDMRTTRICQARDGTVYPLRKGPRPPAHMGCRSTTTPVLKSWEEMGLGLTEAPAGTRASMNGQVPDSETYQSWLRKQDDDFQDEVLGKSRGALFRDGNLELDRFIDDNGKTYTLEDLKRINPDSFKKAGL